MLEQQGVSLEEGLATLRQYLPADAVLVGQVCDGVVNIIKVCLLSITGCCLFVSACRSRCGRCMSRMGLCLGHKCDHPFLHPSQGINQDVQWLSLHEGRDFQVCKLGSVTCLAWRHLQHFALSACPAARRTFASSHIN